jgi:DNA-binding MarR family transcriptional regulator
VDPQDSERVLGETLTFLRALWAVDHGLLSVSKRMRARLGVTGNQRLLLRFVAHFPSLSAGDLAELLHVHPSTLTGTLRLLEGRGFLMREVDPDDARRALFTLTRRGTTVAGARSGTVEEAVQRALDGQAPAKLRAAREVLVALAESLDRAAGAGRPAGSRARR